MGERGFSKEVSVMGEPRVSKELPDMDAPRVSKLKERGVRHAGRAVRQQGATRHGRWIHPATARQTAFLTVAWLAAENAAACY